MKKIKMKFVVEYEVKIDERRVSLKEARTFMKDVIKEYGIKGFTTRGICYKPSGRVVLFKENGDE